MMGESKKEVLPPPEGCKPMMISSREMESLGLKTGSGLRDTVPYKVLHKVMILDQIQALGFMSPFHEHRADLAKLQGEEILIIADPTEAYGENWLLCITRRGFETQMELLMVKDKEREEALRAQEASPEAPDYSNVVFEDKPIKIRSWNSVSSKESHEEVECLSVKPTRPLIHVSVTRMSDEFNADYKLNDRDADQCFVEWRQHKDPNYELARMEQHMGLQGTPALVDNESQTTWYRSVNNALQYEPITMNQRRRQEEIDSDRMHVFLERALCLIEEALQQNETMDIFLDPFANLNEEDATLSNKTESGIKELRSFTDLVYSKNKTLPSIDWHPKKHGILAVAAAANVTFTKRLDLFDKIESSYVLVWNFVDLIHPQLMLESPQDVMMLRFNPAQPHLIAAGLYNGLVIVWDYSKAEHLMSKKKGKDVPSSGAGIHPKGSGTGATGASTSSTVSSAAATDQDTKKQQIPPVKPMYISSIDGSHRRPVADLFWLPPGHEVTNRGHLITTTDPTTSQFVTIAGDGQVCFWDLRYKDPKYRGIIRNKIDKNASKDGPTEVPFLPIYSIALTKVDSTGELALKCFCFEKLRDDSLGLANSQPTSTSATNASSSSASSSAGNPSAAPSLSTRIFCGTEEGEFIYADWRPHAAAKIHKDDDSGHGGTHHESGGTSTVEYVQWIVRDHFRPTVAICISPFFSSIFLTISEATFHIWNVTSQKADSPIYESPFSPSALTCAAFSPTRPGVFYIGKADGILEVWDFIDQSHRASLSMSVTASALTSIEFRPQITNPTASTSATVAPSVPTSAPTAGGSSVAGKLATGGAAAGGGGANTSSATANANLNVKQQLVAVGDQNGNLHILEIPRNLSRASSGERQMMESFFRRENERIKTLHETSGTVVPSNAGASASQASSMNSTSNSTSGNAPISTSPGKEGQQDDEFFKRMEADFRKEIGLDTALT